MIIFLTGYLIGYFISFGLIIGIHEKTTLEVFVAAVGCSLLSWINVGLYLSDFQKEKIKPNE